MDTRKGVRSLYESWRGLGVVHEVHQDAPKCTKTVTISWQSKEFLICHKRLIWSISGFNGHLKRDRSHTGIVLLLIKCTKMNQNGHFSIALHKKFFCVVLVSIFKDKQTFERGRLSVALIPLLAWSLTCSRAHGRVMGLHTWTVQKFVTLM